MHKTIKNMGLLFAIISFVFTSMLVAINNVKTKVEKQQALLNIAMSMSSMIVFYAVYIVLKMIWGQ